MQNTVVTILVFIALYQLSSRTSIRPLVSALIVTLVPLFYLLALRTIFGVSFSNLLQWRDIFTVILQFGAALLVFYRLHNDDSHTTWLVWGVLGVTTIAFLIPGLVLFVTSP